MSIDRQGTALAVLRISIGIFFIFEALGKIRWLTNSSILAAQLETFRGAVAPGSISAWYLNTIAIPGVRIFARLVPLGEFISGFALVLGFWTPLFAFIAFFMAMNFQLANGALFRYSFLTSGYGLPVLGSTLALAIGGSRLRWSIR